MARPEAITDDSSAPAPAEFRRASSDRSTTLPAFSPSQRKRLRWQQKKEVGTRPLLLTIILRQPHTNTHTHTHGSAPHAAQDPESERGVGGGVSAMTEGESDTTKARACRRVSSCPLRAPAIHSLAVPFLTLSGILPGRPLVCPCLSVSMTCVGAGSSRASLPRSAQMQPGRGGRGPVRLSAPCGLRCTRCRQRRTWSGRTGASR